MATYCQPSDIITDLVTPTLTVGAANAAFPLINLKDRKAHTVFKSTGTGATIQWVFGSPKTLQGIALINRNDITATLTNGAGLNEAIAMPATPLDGHRLDPWKSLVGLANTTSTTWTLALTSATVVAIGEVLLIETVRDIPIIWGVELGERHETIIHATDYGVRLKYGMGVRQRMVRGRVTDVTYYDDILALQRDARGPLRNFALMQDLFEAGTNDCLYVDLTMPDRTFTFDTLNNVLMDLEFTEQQKGLAL